MVIKHLHGFVENLEVKQNGEWVHLSKNIKDITVEKDNASIICNGDSLLDTFINDKEGRANNSAFDRIIKAFDDRIDALAPHFSEIKFIFTGYPTPTNMIGKLNETPATPAPAVAVAVEEEKKVEQQQNTNNTGAYLTEKAKFMLGKLDFINFYRFRCIEPFLIKRAAERSSDSLKIVLELAAVNSIEEVMSQSQHQSGSTKYVLCDIDSAFYYDTTDSSNQETVIVYFSRNGNRYKWFKRSDLLKVFLGESLELAKAPLVASQMMHDYSSDFSTFKSAGKDKCPNCTTDAAGHYEFKRGNGLELRSKDHTVFVCPNKYVELAKKPVDQLEDSSKIAYEIFSLKNRNDRMKLLNEQEVADIKRFALPDSKFSLTPKSELLGDQIINDVVTSKITTRQAAMKCTINEERFKDYAEIGAALIDPRFEKRRKALRSDFDFIACYRYHLYNLWVHLNHIKCTTVEITREDLLNFIFTDSRNVIQGANTQSNNKKVDDKKGKDKAQSAQSKFKFLSMEDDEDEDN